MEWVCAILVPGKLVKVSFAFVKSTGKPDGDQVPRFFLNNDSCPIKSHCNFYQESILLQWIQQKTVHSQSALQSLCFYFVFDFAGFHKNSLQQSQCARKICFRACKCNLVGYAWAKFLAGSTLKGYFEHQTWCTSL